MSDSLKSVLLPYQRAWIADRSAVKVYEKSRRVGITWTEAADRALTAAASKPAGMDGWYIGYNRDIAREFIEITAEWARRFNKAASAIEEIAIDDENKGILAYRIHFASGHKVVALSSRPSNLRGKDGCAVIDEAAFHGDLPGLLKAALAFTMWGGRVHVISTHNGADNPFNELVTDIRAGRKPYSLHRTTLDDALNEGLFHTICRVRGTRWSEAAEGKWRARVFADYGDEADEELLCIPNASSGVFLPSVLVESCMSKDIPVLRWQLPYSFLERGNAALYKDAEDWCEEYLKPVLVRLDPGLMSVFGEDFGRSGDLTVIWPMQLSQTLTWRTPFVVELSNVPFRQQEKILFYIVDKLPRFIGGAMDARGNGQYLAEQAALHYGSRIEQVMLTTEWYRESMPKYKAAFEDAKIELPRDAEILADHRLLAHGTGRCTNSGTPHKGRGWPPAPWRFGHCRGARILREPD
jgi:phage FluMu gp28-like protein